ncbi:unnamed protein product [Rotaria socialis]
MSSYFFQRIKNLPTTANNSNSNDSRLMSNAKTTIKTEVTPSVSDDELLTSALQFEQTPQYKQAEEHARRAREPQINNTDIRTFFKQPNSPIANISSSSLLKSLNTSASTSDIIPVTNDRLKQELHTSKSSSKKRPANDSSDDDIIPLELPSSSIVRPPVKKLPNSKPDFHSFAPPNQSVNARTKAILTTLRSRRARGEQVPMTQIVAEEQLRIREQLMRKPKPPIISNEKTTSQEKKTITSVKRKLNELESPVPKKIRASDKTPKNAFERLVHDVTETMVRVTLTNAITTDTTTVSSSLASSRSALNLTTAQSSSSISSTLSLQSISTNMKEKSSKRTKMNTYDDYLIYILKWPVSLVDELEPEAGILYKDFLGENVYPVPLLELYSSFDEYEEITLPWLFEETFEEIKRSIKMNDHKLAGTEFDAVLHQTRILKSGIYELKSQTLHKRIPNTSQYREMFSDDDLVIITLPNQPVNKIFGLVRSGERIIEKARLHKSYHDHPDVKIRPPVWFCYEYNIRIFGSNMKILDGSKIKIKAITSLTATLRRFKALASMRSCPLFENLLSPSLNDDIFQITNKRESSMEDKHYQAYNESQRNVIAEAVSMIRDTRDDNQAKIYMCQGPPGTGKSQTITGIVRALLQSTFASTNSNDQSPTISSSGTSKKIKILICCPSNGGCNEIVRRLIDIFARKTTDSNANQTTPNLPFKLIRCARGGAVSQDIESLSLDVLARKRLEEVLNTGGQNEAIERNLANKEKQKKQLLERIEQEKMKQQSTSANNRPTEELKDLELNLKEIIASIQKLQQTCRKTMPESARRQREREIKLELLQQADICVSTLNYVGNSIFDSFSPFDVNNPMNKNEKLKKPPASSSTIPSLFNCLIIDEAGQCIEIDNYIPLRLGMNRIVLVGDPEQLPATILSRRALEAGLNQSLFERLYKLFKYDLNNPIRMLNIQYRMHDEICKFPSMHIYRSKLKTDKSINQKRKKFLLKPYMILDIVNGQEQLDPVTQSYGNPLEADVVARLVQFINEQAKVPFNQIGIITPYNYQVKLIEQKLVQHNLHQHKIEIGTVDAFQGRQKDVILLSCVRATQITDASTTVGIGFVANRQRLNVSLTRAKYAMYILGHMNSLNVNEDWQKLYSNAVERKAIFQLTLPEQFEWLIKHQQEAQTELTEKK